MNLHRLFIALPLPARIAPAVAKIFHAMAVSEEDYFAVPLQNLHVTLKFLGETEVSRIPSIVTALEDCAALCAVPEVSLTNGLALPLRSPTTIGIGVRQNPELDALFSVVERTLADRSVAHPERRAYRPHITIARIKRSARMKPEDIDKVMTASSTLVWQAGELALYESVLGKGGAEYTILNSFALQ